MYKSYKFIPQSLIRQLEDQNRGRKIFAGRLMVTGIVTLPVLACSSQAGQSGEYR